MNPFVKDSWGNIPLDDAVQFNHLEVEKLLQDYQDSYTPSENQAEVVAEALSKENLESMGPPSDPMSQPRAVKL
ncbi:hypothetical protein QTO34_016044 [Cnephaeus nilssonii]|uniref:Uncharacterized protein n=1 Tax=Cnephaeus nilssonii TaxID=3371016 RepID=A0AA40I5Z6_CNENI|nr:hypothetical protein QTO34_016044 [Eptesicus nilssonii]